MSDYYGIATAVFSAVATGFAAFAAWQAPRAAAKLAESLRRDAEKAQERQRSKLQIFVTLMQERAAIYSETAVKSLNLIEVIFSDSREVCDAWVELFAVFSLMTPRIYQTGPKTSVKSGWSCSMREKRCISGRSLPSGIMGIRS
jgi:hypothetical protein